MEFETQTPPEAEIKKPVIDMEPILEKVAPIEGIFDPDEEVQKLWSVPREQHREAVSVFKDKLARQREAWALCRTNIEERIKANPNLPRDEMVGIVREFAFHYGFADSHVQVAESLVDDYMEMHRRVKEVREEHPENIALINRLTGLKFTTSDESDFTVEVGPISIEIFCSGFNAGRIFEKSEDPVVGFRYAGFASRSSDSKPVYYLVVNCDYASSYPDLYSTIVPHEREHQITRILAPKLYKVSEVRDDVREQLDGGVLESLRHQVNDKVLGSEILQKYESETDPEKKAFLLAEYMRLKREVALNKAKDEIIALQHSKKFFSDLSNIFTSQTGGAYDYLAYLRDFNKKKDDPLWQETAKRVLVDEYGDIIGAAIAAINQLEDHGYSQAETIAMFSDKRLAEWPKTVKRLLEQKERRQSGTKRRNNRSFLTHFFWGKKK